MYLILNYENTGTGVRGSGVATNALDPDTGELTPLTIRILPGDGGGMALSPDGSVICMHGVIGQGQGIFCAAVDTHTGVVSQTTNYYMGAISSVAFSPVGKYLAIEHGHTLGIYTYNPDGTLVFPPLVEADSGLGPVVAPNSGSGQGQGLYVAFDPSGKYIAVLNSPRTNDISILAFDAQAATLSPVVGSPFPFTVGDTPLDCKFAVSGMRLFVTNLDQQAGDIYYLNAFSFDPQTGAVSGPVASFFLPGNKWWNGVSFAVGPQ